MDNLEFVSYDGEFPNLCRGVLTVKINGKTVKFGHHYYDFNFETNSFNNEDKDIPTYEEFWVTGGGITSDYSTYGGPWRLSVAENSNTYPEEIFKLMPQLIELFNENVDWGCCGGCI